MNNELIKRIDYELDAWPRNSTLNKVLKDAKSELYSMQYELDVLNENGAGTIQALQAEIERLSKPYVPMTRDEFDDLLDIWCDIDIKQRPDWASYIEAEVCRRAGLEVVK